MIIVLSVTVTELLKFYVLPTTRFLNALYEIEIANSSVFFKHTLLKCLNL
jgi:hypothetical protein